jgi:hypothetical protein
VAAQKKRLRLGNVDEVIAEIREALASTAATGPGNKYRREPQAPRRIEPFG